MQKSTTNDQAKAPNSLLASSTCSMNKGDNNENNIDETYDADTNLLCHVVIEIHTFVILQFKNKKCLVYILFVLDLNNFNIKKKTSVIKVNHVMIFC